jgi:RimJ/RimL family protein N-acetyltransferase
MSIKIRVTVPEDVELLKKWLAEPGVLRWFPMFDQREIDDAARIWASYGKLGACFTAEWDNEPCGIANLYIQPYKKLSHQCLFAIIVSENFRNKGIGGALLDHIMKVGKEQFHLEYIHLEVYDGNPAINLYRRKGFVEYGVQKHFIKDSGEYINKIMMQRYL